MNLLLDANALLWWWDGSKKLGPRARAIIRRDAADVRVSASTVWEIAIKFQAGRLSLSAPIDHLIPAQLVESGFRMLDVSIDHAVAAATLPEHHVDPFDRMLIAQAQLENLTIVTSDMVFDAYDVKVLDARQ